MAFFQTLCKGSYQECPGFCVKEEGRYPSATKLKLRNFPNKTWSQKKQTLCLLSAKVYRPTKLTWVAFEFCISQKPAGLHSGSLWSFCCVLAKIRNEDASLKPCSFLELTLLRLLWSGLNLKYRRLTSISLKHRVFISGFLSESVSSLAPREKRINTTGQETADAKNYRL